MADSIRESSPRQSDDLADEILRLKEEKKATILAHNYQLPEIQDIADIVGDSLGLSMAAAQLTGVERIVFCGVRFMAETASILSPNTKVLLPDPGAGCSLSDTITADAVRHWKRENPGAVVVAYVNTTADVKAESDYCCTSSNALKVIQSIPQDKDILFLPDMFLGAYVKKLSGRNIKIWPGECHVHAPITLDRIMSYRRSYPDAETLIHPECGCMNHCLYFASDGSLEDGVKFLSTEGMVRYSKESRSRKFIVATETGILHKMRKMNPEKTFIPVDENAVCKYMKMITLDKVLRSLQNDVFEVRVPKETAVKARLAIKRMLDIT